MSLFGRKGLAGLAAAGLVVAALAGCSSGPSTDKPATVTPELQSLYEKALKEGGELIIYSNLVPTTAAKVADAFAKEFPGLKLRPSFFAAAPMEARIDAELDAGNLIADVIQVGDRLYLDKLADAGNFADLTDVPFVGEIPEQYRPSPDYFAYQMSIMSITYNTNAIKDPPKTYEDVLKLGNRAGISDPRSAVAGIGLDYLTMKNYGPSFWQEVKDKGLPVYASIAQAGPEVISGNLDAIIHVNTLGACAEIEGKPVKVVYPKEGVYANPQFTAVLKDAHNPATAALYAAWTASPEGQELINNADCTVTPRSDVKLNPAIPTLADLNVVETHYDDPAWVQDLLDLQKQAVAAAGLPAS